MSFNYLGNKTQQEFIINKSRFITHLIPVESINDIISQLDQLKHLHPKANHFCYGYLLSNQSVQKYSDDGEPHNTAGFPIIDVLLKNNLDNILAIVIRYFGGIKLGAGGLTRAYRGCVADTLKTCQLIEKIEVPLYQIILSYPVSNKIHQLLITQATMVNQTYDQEVTYQFYTLSSTLLSQISELAQGIKPTVIKMIKVIKT